jgi:uncharacterized protein (TIRG00374 family)
VHSSFHPTFSKTLRLFFAIGGTAGIFFLAWKYLSWQVFMDSFGKLHPAPLAISAALYIAITAVRAVRFLLVGADITFGDAFAMASVHNALLRVMPFRSGEIAYAVMLKRMGKGGLGEGVATVFLLRLLDLAVVIVVGAASVGSYFVSMKNLWTVALIGLFVSALFFVFFAADSIIRFADGIVSPRLGDKKRALWSRAIQAVKDTLKLSFRRRVLLLSSTLLLWLMILAWFYFLMRGTGMSIGLFDGLSAGMLGVVGSMLPLSIIGSFGPLEGGLAIGFCAVGYGAALAANQSIVISTLTFVQNWTIAIPGWFWVLARSRLKPSA